MFAAWLAGPLLTAAAELPAAGLTTRDRELADVARQQALERKPSQAPTYWSNGASGNAGVVTPLRTYRTSTGYYCRVYRERTFLHPSGVTTMTLTACRDGGGVWRVVAE